MPKITADTVQAAYDSIANTTSIFQMEEDTDVELHEIASWASNVDWLDMFSVQFGSWDRADIEFVSMLPPMIREQFTEPLSWLFCLGLMLGIHLERNRQTLGDI
ncbi:MAG: hypothetical protein ABSF18_07650 [Gammaproteobacteria bacterium]|jgi:hypothetical protein